MIALNIEDSHKHLLGIAKEFDRICTKYNIPYYETSVKSGENINEAFSKLFQLVYKSTKYNSKFDVIQANNNNLNLDVLNDNNKHLQDLSTSN